MDIYVVLNTRYWPFLSDFGPETASKSVGRLLSYCSTDYVHVRLNFRQESNTVNTQQTAHEINVYMEKIEVP